MLSFIFTLTFFIFAKSEGCFGAWGGLVVKATSRTIPGSIPGGVTGFFSDVPSDRSMALGST